MSVDFLSKALVAVHDQDVVLDAVDEQVAKALMEQGNAWEIAAAQAVLERAPATEVMAAQMRRVAASLWRAAEVRLQRIERRAAKGDV
jgi:hypothetical protein